MIRTFEYCEWNDSLWNFWNQQNWHLIEIFYWLFFNIIYLQWHSHEPYGIKSTNNYILWSKALEKPQTFQAIMYYVMDILFGEINLKRDGTIWPEKWPFVGRRNVFEFKWFFVPGENNNNHHSMFKPQAISPNLLSFYSVPMICGLLLNWICGQWIARVFDNFYPFNHQLTTNNIWTTDAHWSATNSFVKLIDNIENLWNEEIKCHRISFFGK